MKRETIAIHGGYDGDPATKAVAVPIYQTAAYSFDSADHAAALFNLEADGFRYSRINNPTTSVLERRVAELEGGLQALCVSSGQAATYYAISNVASLGTNIVSVPQLYGTTHTLFAHLLPSQGVTVRFADSDRPEDFDKLIDGQTRALFCETVGNPAGNICDIEGLARVAHKHGVPLIVDNTVATPILLRPIEYGADIVVHSLTKFMGGHGTTLGGAVVDSGKFPWKEHAERFPMFNQPDASYQGLVYTEHFGSAAYIGRCRSVYLRTTGAVLSALSAFLLLQGIETLPLRIERHVANGRQVAEFLRRHPHVEWINYAGFPDNPYHALAQKYLGGNACSLLTFGVKGGFKAAKRFYDALQLVKRLVNLGDAKSLACHPASTTHRQMSPEEQHKAGLTPEMIRLSIGIEHIDDIMEDLDQALNATRLAHEQYELPQRFHRELLKESPMPIRVVTNPEKKGAAQAIHIGLVNNMPDGALKATERQFITLLDAAAEGMAVHLSLYAFPDLPRSQAGQAHVSRFYSSVEDLWDTQLDGLIVTGTEACAQNLLDEPCWPGVKALVDWAERNTYSAIWSCLASHAATLCLDGIVRRRLPDKRFGVFECARVSDHELTAGVPFSISVPHSRWNETSGRELTDCGYRVLTRDQDGGVDAFVKQRKSLFVFFQGHPEYDANTLLLEYRRDIGRFLKGERPTYPSMPLGYFDQRTADALRRLEDIALSGRSEKWLANFPAADFEAKLVNRWRAFAVQLYGNWLSHIGAQKDMGSTPPRRHNSTMRAAAG